MRFYIYKATTRQSQDIGGIYKVDNEMKEYVISEIEKEAAR